MKRLIVLSLLSLTACQTGLGAPSLSSLGCSGATATPNFRIQCVPAPPRPVQTMAPCGGGMEPPPGAKTGFRVQCLPPQPVSASSNQK